MMNLNEDYQREHLKPSAKGRVAFCYALQKSTKMKTPCTPQVIKKTHQKARSWRAAAKELNALYGVHLPHLTWRDYATGRRDIADDETRAALMLGPRPCPRCGNKPSVHFSRLLKRLNPEDLKHWHRLRNQKKFNAAKEFLNEVYSRKIPNNR